MSNRNASTHHAKLPLPPTLLLWKVSTWKPSLPHLLRHTSTSLTSHLSPPHPPNSTLPTFTSTTSLPLQSPSLRPSLPSHIYPLPASAPHDHFPPFTSPISPIPSPSHTQWSASWSSVVSGRMRRKLLRESRQPSTSTWLVPSESSRGVLPLLLHTTSMYSR